MNDAYFSDLYGSSDDPYQLRTRWYEERKQSLLLSALPQRHYQHAYEPGCGIGELTVALSRRCDQVLAADFSERAVEIASKRTRGLRNVRIEQHSLPDDWPLDAGPFDLIVLSELGYFFDEAAMRQLAGCCRHTLASGGTLVACNWRPDFKERALPTDAVHAQLASIGLPRIVLHEEDDFRLEVWSGDGRSVAQREGIR